MLAIPKQKTNLSWKLQSGCKDIVIKHLSLWQRLHYVQRVQARM